MKLMIDIPKQSYEDIKNDEWIDTEPIHNMVNAIKNGTPLSEELEKIKAELNNKSFAYSLTDNFENDIIIGVIKVSDMEKIIDKHISELKGETNDTCPSYDKWYACPIESKKPENKKEMEEYLKWLDERDES